MATHFTLRYETQLAIGQLWPDGDAPTDPTAEDVAVLVDRHGGPWAVAWSWNLADRLLIAGDDGSCAEVG